MLHRWFAVFVCVMFFGAASARAEEATQAREPAKEQKPTQAAEPPQSPAPDSPAEDGAAAAEPAPSEETQPEIVVVGKKVEQPQGSYTATTAPTVTRTDAPIATTPVSVQVVPRAVIDDQADLRLKDVTRNVSGVAPVKTEGNGIQFENAYIRGFSQRSYLDGVNLYTMPPLDMAGVERVDVVKGPGSVLYGEQEPGGMINVIPRLPEVPGHTEVTSMTGSYDFYRGQVDSTGPLTDTLSYRLIGDYQNSGSFRDFLNQESMFFGPSVRWNPEKQTRITAWLWYQHLDRPQDNGVVFTHDGKPVGPITRNLAGPGNTTQYIEDVTFGTQLEHDVTHDFTVRDKLLVHSFTGRDDAIRWGSVTAKNTIAPYYDASTFDNLELDFVSDALWRFNAGPTKHQVLFGMEIGRSDYDYNRLTDAKLPAINIFNPVYPHGPYHPLPGVSPQNTITTPYAGFLQDQVDALDNRLHILVGGRLDYVDQYHKAWQTGKEYTEYDLAPSGRAGVLYDLTPWMSPYAAVSTSFNPNAPTSINATGQTLDPTTGLEYEAGSKFTFFDKRLLLTAAAFQITKDNVPVADPANAGSVLNGGRMRSRGVEVDALGQITPELQLIGNYAYTPTWVLDSDTLPVGAPFAGIPRHSGSVWLKYTFQTGALKDFGFGMGCFAASDKSGDNNHTFDLPAYARLDAGAWYTHTLPSGQKIKLQVNAQNLANTRYYESSTSAGSVEPGTPFTLMGTLTFSF